MVLELALDPWGPVQPCSKPVVRVLLLQLRPVAWLDKMLAGTSSRMLAFLFLKALRLGDSHIPTFWLLL